jgi:hypothetical protein
MGREWSFIPKRFPASGRDQHIVGPGDYDAESVKSDRRAVRRPSSTKPESSFVSQTLRFEDPASGVSKNTLGPGQYGVPKGIWQWGRGAVDPSSQRPYAMRLSASFVSGASKSRVNHRARHGDSSQLGPGSHWSQSMEDLHSIARPSTSHSTRGTSGFLASERPALVRPTHSHTPCVFPRPPFPPCSSSRGYYQLGRIFAASTSSARRLCV